MGKIFDAIWAFVFGFLSYAGMIVYAIVNCKLKTRKVSEYKNITYLDGSKVTLFSFLKRFDVNQEVVILNSSSGKVVCIHGTYGGFTVKGKEYDLRDLPFLIKDDTKDERYYESYALISCCNASHDEYVGDGIDVYRDSATLTYHSSIIIIFNNTLYTFSNAWVDLYAVMQMPITYRKYIIPTLVACIKG